LLIIIFTILIIVITIINITFTIYHGKDHAVLHHIFPIPQISKNHRVMTSSESQEEMTSMAGSSGLESLEKVVRTRDG
jgi:1,4-dihydroxy-2-naphthoate octaprenyltransferase